MKTSGHHSQLSTLDMSSAARRQKPKGLVIGGAGFVGQHLVEQLIEQGQYSVSVADLRDPGLPAATFVSLDIRDKQQVAAACLGACPFD